MQELPYNLTLKILLQVSWTCFFYYFRLRKRYIPFCFSLAKKRNCFVKSLLYNSWIILHRNLISSMPMKIVESSVGRFFNSSVTSISSPTKEAKSPHKKVHCRVFVMFEYNFTECLCFPWYCLYLPLLRFMAV